MDTSHPTFSFLAFRLAYVLPKLFASTKQQLPAIVFNKYLLPNPTPPACVQ